MTVEENFAARRSVMNHVMSDETEDERSMEIMMNTMKKWVTGVSLAAFLLTGGLFPAISEAAHSQHHHSHKIHSVVKYNPVRISRPVHRPHPVVRPIGVRPMPGPRPIHRPRPIHHPRPYYYCSYHGCWHRHHCHADRNVAGAVLVGAILGALAASR